MKHLDITVDIETLACSANAAILQIAAIAWDRDNPDSPLIPGSFPFVGNVDIRSCVKDDFDFDQKTIKWWSQQKEDVKNSVLTSEAHPLKDVLEGFKEWVCETYSQNLAESVCLWAQGSDFDIAILRNAFSKYNMEFPIDHAYFRDARTFILEMGAYLLMQDNPIAGIAEPSQIYNRLPKTPAEKLDAHNAVNDAYRTTCNVWALLRRLINMRDGKLIYCDDSGNVVDVRPKSDVQPIGRLD